MRERAPSSHAARWQSCGCVWCATEPGNLCGALLVYTTLCVVWCVCVVHDNTMTGSGRASHTSHRRFCMCVFVLDACDVMRLFRIELLFKQNCARAFVRVYGYMTMNMSRMRIYIHDA